MEESGQDSTSSSSSEERRGKGSGPKKGKSTRRSARLKLVEAESSSSAHGEESQVTSSAESGVGRGRGIKDGRVASGSGRGASGSGCGRVASGRGRGASGSGTMVHRGRGRGSRGKKAPGLSAFDENRIQELQSNRKTHIRQSISVMSETQIRDLLEQVVDKQPGLLFDIWEMTVAASQHSPPSPPTDGWPTWCKCTHSREMGEDIEKLCFGLKPENCLSLSSELDLLVLDEHVLQAANWYMGDVLAADPGYDRKAKRHAGYRQFTLLRHGKVGAGVRRVIPSCVVWKIRDRFPAPNGQYVGFKANRLA